MRSANLLESKDVAPRRQVSNPADPLATPWSVLTNIVQVRRQWHNVHSWWTSWTVHNQRLKGHNRLQTIEQFYSAIKRNNSSRLFIWWEADRNRIFHCPHTHTHTHTHTYIYIYIYIYINKILIAGYMRSRCLSTSAFLKEIAKLLNLVLHATLTMVKFCVTRWAGQVSTLNTGKMLFPR